MIRKLLLLKCIAISIAIVGAGAFLTMTVADTGVFIGGYCYQSVDGEIVPLPGVRVEVCIGSQPLFKKVSESGGQWGTTRECLSGAPYTIKYIPPAGYEWINVILPSGSLNGQTGENFLMFNIDCSKNLGRVESLHMQGLPATPTPIPTSTATPAPRPTPTPVEVEMSDPGVYIRFRVRETPYPHFVLSHAGVDMIFSGSEGETGFSYGVTEDGEIEWFDMEGGPGNFDVILHYTHATPTPEMTRTIIEVQYDCERELEGRMFVEMGALGPSHAVDCWYDLKCVYKQIVEPSRPEEVR